MLYGVHGIVSCLPVRSPRVFIIEQVFVANHIAMAVVDCVSLPWQQELLVEQARNPVHLKQVLNVLLLSQPLQRDVELTIVLDPLAESIRSNATASETTAEQIKES